MCTLLPTRPGAARDEDVEGRHNRCLQEVRGLLWSVPICTSSVGRTQAHVDRADADDRVPPTARAGTLSWRTRAHIDVRPGAPTSDETLPIRDLGRSRERQQARKSPISNTALRYAVHGQTVLSMSLPPELCERTASFAGL